MTVAKQQFLYTLEATRPELLTNPDAWTEADNRTASDHFAYLQQATAEGVLILAGRSPDNVGPAVVIFEADSEAAARQFMEGDPFVSTGFARARLHPFRVALLRERQVSGERA